MCVTVNVRVGDSQEHIHSDKFIARKKISCSPELGRGKEVGE